MLPTRRILSIGAEGAPRSAAPLNPLVKVDALELSTLTLADLFADLAASRSVHLAIPDEVVSADSPAAADEATEAELALLDEVHAELAAERAEDRR